MSKKIIVRTGEKAPVSGLYRASGSNKEITLAKGKVVPPNNQGGLNKFILEEKAKHNKQNGK